LGEHCSCATKLGEQLLTLLPLFRRPWPQALKGNECGREIPLSAGSGIGLGGLPLPGKNGNFLQNGMSGAHFCLNFVHFYLLHRLIGGIAPIAHYGFATAIIHVVQKHAKTEHHIQCPNHYT